MKKLLLALLLLPLFGLCQTTVTVGDAATDALLLGGQNSAFHLGRANHTGTQTLSTISDASTLTLLGGRAGGQTLIGGTGASETLTLQSTASATLGKILFGSSGYDEVNNRLNLGVNTDLSSRLGIQGEGSTNSTISFKVQNSATARLFTIFDDGSISIGFATAQPHRLFISDAIFGTGISVSEIKATGNNEGIRIQTSGATSGNNTGLKVIAQNASGNNFALDITGDVNATVGANSWSIGVVAPSTAIKFCSTVNTGSSHTTVGFFKTTNDEATNIALKGEASGAGTVNTGGTFSASGGTTNYGLLVTDGLTGIGTSTPDNTLDVDGFIEYDNKAITLGVGVTTFAVTANGMTVTGDGGANTLATITGVTNGGFLTLTFVDGLVTITDDDFHNADSIDLNASFTSADDVVLRLEHDGVSWYEVSRSVN